MVTLIHTRAQVTNDLEMFDLLVTCMFPSLDVPFLVGPYEQHLYPDQHAGYKQHTNLTRTILNTGVD